jgi:hypothetical protein
MFAANDAVFAIPTPSAANMKFERQTCDRESRELETALAFGWISPRRTTKTFWQARKDGT